MLRFNDFGTTKKTKKFGGTCKYMRLVYTTPLTAVFPEVRNLLNGFPCLTLVTIAQHHYLRTNLVICDRELIVEV